MYANQRNGKNGVGQRMNNYNRFNPPPNPYESSPNNNNNNNNKKNIIYNNGGGGGYMEQRQKGNARQYNGYNSQQQRPPNVGLGIDDNPYDMDQMDLYNQNPDSEDSSGGGGDDQNINNNDDAQINIGSYQSGPQIKITNDNMNDVFIPEIPDIPQMVQINDINMQSEEEQLHLHVGFVIKLNARLVQLNAECRELYPKLAKDLVDSKISEFQSMEYKNLMTEKVKLKKKCDEYEQQIQTLLPVQNLNNDLNQEIEKLRTLTVTYSKQQQYQEKDYREMISLESREYVNELQKQLDIYRDKVIYLSQQSQSCMAAIKNSVQHQKATQESISNAYNELKPLQEHLSFLEESTMEQQQETNNETRKLQQEFEQIKNENKSKIEQLEFKNAKLQNEIDILKENQKTVQSEKIANKAQIEEHIEYKYKSQIQALEERLSKMTVARITMEDDFAQRQKQEQERADKYRAKYESVKQHVKTLEMQKVEYTRVNMQLRNQNNQFRTMITQLQNQLKMITIDQAQLSQSQQIIPQQPPIPQQPSPIIQQQSNLSDQPPQPPQPPNDNNQNNQNNQNPMKQQLLQLQQQQQNLIRQQNMIRAQQEQNKQNDQYGVGGHGYNKPPPLKEQQQQQQQHHVQSQSYAVGMNNNNNNNNNGIVPNPPNPNHVHSQTYVHGMNNNVANNNVVPPNNANNAIIDPQQAMANQMGIGGGGGSSLNMIPSAHRELWGKRTKIISEKGTKKRILVEWHFVTSDNQPHTVVLQHTQDTKPKTRRMLWVDGSEKYNNKSSASSFRIEIDKDVVVVSIDQLDQYQYRLTINNASYHDAFKLWENRQQQR